MNDDYIGAHYTGLSTFVYVWNLPWLKQKKFKGVYVIEACEVFDEGNKVFEACRLE